MADTTADAAAGAAAMDTTEAVVEKKEFTLEIMHQIKIAQSQNGLRHGDYQRYRQYCSRRLRRVRKTLAFTNVPKGAFTLKKVAASDVTDANHLTIPLLNAERAWSYAMMLKNDLTADTPRKKYHLLKRLGKAADWSKALEALSSTCADARTQLEIEAYSSQMQGNLYLEKDQHEEALGRFNHAKVLFDQLGRIGGMALKALCDEKIAALEPSLRYCTYVLQRRTKKGGDVSEGEVLSGLGQVDDLLQSKLNSVMEANRLELAQALDRVEWQGKTVPLKNDKVQLLLVTITDLEKQMSSAEGNKLNELLSSIAASYEEALEAIRQDIRNADKLKSKGTTGNLGVSEDDKAHLRALKAYITFRKLVISKQRNLDMAAAMGRKLEDQKTTPAVKDKKSQVKIIKPDDVVHLHEKVMDNLQEMAELDQRHDQLSEASFKAELAMAKAHRCFYLAEAYARFQKMAEAHALFQLSRERAAEALALGHAGTMDQLKALQKRAEGRLYYIQALVAVQREETTKQLGAVQLDERKSKQQGAPMFDKLDHYYAAEQLVSFPPEPQATPCKPALFDLAFNELAFNDVSHRFPKKGAGGWFGGLFGGQ